jgi:hypothetical protein
VNEVSEPPMKPFGKNQEEDPEHTIAAIEKLVQSQQTNIKLLEKRVRMLEEQLNSKVKQ